MSSYMPNYIRKSTRKKKSKNKSRPNWSFFLNLTAAVSVLVRQTIREQKIFSAPRPKKKSATSIQCTQHVNRFASIADMIADKCTAIQLSNRKRWLIT